MSPTVARGGISARSPRLRQTGRWQHEGADLLDPPPVPQPGEQERAVAAHAPRVPLHDLERGADMRRQVRLVDDQQVGASDRRAALARDLLAGGDVDDIDRQAAARTIDAIEAAIAEALAAFTPAECSNYFTNSGYEPD